MGLYLYLQLKLETFPSKDTEMLDKEDPWPARKEAGALRTETHTTKITELQAVKEGSSIKLCKIAWGRAADTPAWKPWGRSCSPQTAGFARQGGARRTRQAEGGKQNVWVPLTQHLRAGQCLRRPRTCQNLFRIKRILDVTNPSCFDSLPPSTIFLQWAVSSLYEKSAFTQAEVHFGALFFL